MSRRKRVSGAEKVKSAKVTGKKLNRHEKAEKKSHLTLAKLHKKHHDLHMKMYNSY